MTGSQFQKSSRSTSFSPRLKASPIPYFKFSQEALQYGSYQQSNLLEKSKSNNKCTTPVRPGKRRHQAIVSPVTTRSESSSPKAKLRSIVPIQLSFKTTAAVVSKVTATTQEDVCHLLLTCDPANLLKGSLAVPKVSPEPPNPSLLPSPPKHWVGEKNAQCLAEKQQCRVVTQCLMTHLASSGILISAQ